MITQTELLILQTLWMADKPLRSSALSDQLRKRDSALSHPTLMRQIAGLIKRRWVAEVRVDKSGKRIADQRRLGTRAWNTAYIATVSVDEVLADLGEVVASAERWEKRVTARLKKVAVPEDQSLPLGDTDKVTLLEPIETKLHLPFLFRFVMFDLRAERYRIRVEADGEGFPAEAEVRASQAATLPNLQVGGKDVVVVTSDELGFRADRCPIHFRWRVSALASDDEVISESKWATAEVETGPPRSDWSAACDLLLAAGRTHEAKQQFDRALEIYGSLPDPDLRLVALIEMYERRYEAISEQLDRHEELRLDDQRQQELESNRAIVKALLAEYRSQAAARPAQRRG